MVKDATAANLILVISSTPFSFMGWSIRSLGHFVEQDHLLSL
jgi:hypothetical protein